MVEGTISVQTLGVGLAAFIATLSAIFLYVNAYSDRVARAFGHAMTAAALWAWCGFASAVAAEQMNMDIARTLRMLSMLGNIWLAFLFVRFALVYKNEHTPLTKAERTTGDVYLLSAAALSLFVASDIFLRTSIMAGTFFPGAAAPVIGPMFDVFVLYYCLCIVAIYIVMRRRVALETGPTRRGHVILLYAMTVGASAGVAGFAAWYGIYWPPLTAVRAFAMPLLAFSAFYAMGSHNLFNVRVAAANAFVFAIWSFLFLRILLSPTLSEAVPDIWLLAALIVLGILLIRSFTKELDTRLRIERVERERAIEQSKAEFISIAAHQLRTPLAGIRWTFNVLESASGLNKEQQELLKRASERTRDVVERVNEMLRAARLTDGGFKLKLVPQDIRPILRESIELFEGAAHTRNIRLESSIPRKILLSRVDADKFAIAVQNLIDNAIKYTQTGSVTLSAAQIENRIEIRVTDTGIGISDADTTHLFEKFYRHEDAVKMFTDGSGLGLFIVKKIVDGHGGTIKIESKKGEGTAFVLSIPASKKA